MGQVTSAADEWSRRRRRKGKRKEKGEEKGGKEGSMRRWRKLKVIGSELI